LRQHVSHPARPKSDRPPQETESPRRHRRPFGHLAAEPRVDVHYYHLRALTKTFGDKGFEHCGEIAVSGRLRVDDTRIRRPRQPGGGATVVPDDPFAGGRGRERGPRTVGPENHVGPASFGGPYRGRRRGVSVDDLQTYSGTVGPESKGARPGFPESGQRPRQRGNQDGASCHAHNLSESNNRPTPRGVRIVTFHCGSTPLPEVLSRPPPTHLALRRSVGLEELDLDERMHTTPWFHATNIPNAPATNLVQIGIGGWQAPRAGVKVGRARGTTVRTVGDVERVGVEKIVETALELAWQGAKAVYLSFDIDIDVIDSGFVPGTGWLASPRSARLGPWLRRGRPVRHGDRRMLTAL
jgi:hypothetical protein